jgi:Phage major coat protein, Gp8.
MKERFMRALSVVGLGGLALVPGLSFAAVPAAVGSALTNIQTDALAMVDLVWPVLGVILGAFVLIKLGKRVINKI